MQTVLFEETQHVSPLIVLISAVIVGVVFGLLVWRIGWPAPRWLWLSFGGTVVFIALVLGAMRMHTKVTDAAIELSIFYVVHRAYPLDRISQAQALVYAPMREFGGWGLRYGPKGTAYSVSGSRGVRLTLQDGSQITVGSQRPDALEAALNAAMSG